MSVCVCACVGSTLNHQPDLDERAHVGKVRVHSSTVREVLVHPLHELREAAERQHLCGTVEHTRGTHTLSCMCVCACLHVRVSTVNIISYRWFSLLTVVQYDQQRGEQVTHPLDIANVQMLPNITVEIKSYWVFTAFKYTPKLYHGVFLLFCALWFESEIDRKVWEMGRTCSKGPRAGIEPRSLELGLYCNDTPSAQWATRVPHMETFFNVYTFKSPLKSSVEKDT